MERAGEVSTDGASVAMMDLPHRTVARDLAFPEGPVALSDGSVLLVEVRGAARQQSHARRDL